MSEQLQLQPPDPLTPFEADLHVPQVETLDPIAFGEHLDTMQAIPEVTENREGITAAARELTEKFDIEASLADDPGKMTLFAAIANRWSKAAETDTAEKTFLADSLALLAHNNSPILQAIYDQATAEESGYNAAYHESILKQYTNRQMTDELLAAIDGGLLDAVKRRLGVTPENEDPYKVAVLSISDLHALRGMQPDVDHWPDPRDYADETTRHAAVDRYKERLAASMDVQEWRKDLVARGEQFMDDNGIDSVPPAWKVDLNGTTYLCMPQTFVEKILHPEQFVDGQNNNLYDQKAWEADLAALEHEYTHTQGGLSIDGELAFGLNLEELRAEHFSGNKNGYGELKGLSSDIGIVTGTHLVGYFAGKQKGGSSNQVFQEIAQNVGLDNMLDVVMLQPSAYVQQTENALIKSTYQHLGSFDGVITRLLDREVQNGNEQAFTERMDARLARLADLGDIKGFMSYRRRSQGLTVLSELYEQRAIELGYITPEAS